jgi:hypothetical protein
VANLIGFPPIGRVRSFGSHDFPVLSLRNKHSNTGTALVLDESFCPIAFILGFSMFNISDVSGNVRAAQQHG